MSEVAAPAPVVTTPAPAAPPAATPAPASPSTPLGGGDSSWRASLPPDLQSHQSLSKFESPEALAKSYLEMEKFKGAHLPKPSDSWTGKEWGDLYDAIGRPKSAAEYGFAKPTNAPEGLSYNETQDKWYSEAAHKAGLTKAQATALREAHMTMSIEQHLAQVESQKSEAAAAAKELTNLQSKFGPEWDNSVSAAKKVINGIGGEKVKELLIKKGLDSDPTMIEFMINVGKTLSDHSIITGTPRIGATFASDPSQAKSEIDRMKADPEIAKSLADYRHPQHDANLKKFNALFPIAYPNKA